MSIKKLSFFLIVVFLFSLLSCDSKPPQSKNRIVVGISSDVKTFNPLFAFSVDEGAIVELLYLSLVDFRWDEEKGELKSLPMLARKFEWAGDSSFITFFLRDDIFWTDSVRITPDDVVFSLDVYSDPLVQSRLYGTFKSLHTNDENHIDIEKTIEVKSSSEFNIHFAEDALPNLYELGIPIIPKHVFDSVGKEELVTSGLNFNPVSSGPFKLKKWDKNQTITLEANEQSFLYDPENVSELVFKIVPDYTSRILQIKKGDIDLVELVKTEDIEDLRGYDDLQIVPVVGREYDYVGWNNIDPNEFSSGGKIEPHSLFGSPNVRKALTHAINRNEILDEYLLGLGEIAVAPVSPIFKKAFDESIIGYEYDIVKAKRLLEDEGWADSNNDGILDKDGNDFSFTLHYPAGNPLREFAATIMKNNLKAVGIEMDMEVLELGTFIDNLFAKKLDAWMAAWYIPIPLELKPYWYSDLESTPLNFVSYQNSTIDKILDNLETKIPLQQRINFYKKFQELIHRDEPVTFLYWIPNISVYNRKIKNINVSPLGTVTHCWEWSVKNN